MNGVVGRRWCQCRINSWHRGTWTRRSHTTRSSVDQTADCLLRTFGVVNCKIIQAQRRLTSSRSARPATTRILGLLIVMVSFRGEKGFTSHILSARCDLPPSRCWRSRNPYPPDQRQIWTQTPYRHPVSPATTSCREVWAHGQARAKRGDPPPDRGDRLLARVTECAHSFTASRTILAEILPRSV